MNFPENLKSGGNIHIKKSHEGRFTVYKKKTGKTTEEALHSKDPHVRQMANFAKNSKTWKHQIGGTARLVDKVPIGYIPMNIPNYYHNPQSSQNSGNSSGTKMSNDKWVEFLNSPQGQQYKNSRNTDDTVYINNKPLVQPAPVTPVQAFNGQIIYNTDQHAAGMYKFKTRNTNDNIQTGQIDAPDVEWSDIDAYGKPVGNIITIPHNEFTNNALKGTNQLYDKSIIDKYRNNSVKLQTGGDMVSKLGYQNGSPFSNRKQLTINTPNGTIDMSNSGRMIYAEDETGMSKIRPPYSGMHQFNGNKVVETPIIFQKGGNINKFVEIPINNPNGGQSTYAIPLTNNNNGTYIGYNSQGESRTFSADIVAPYINKQNNKAITTYSNDINIKPQVDSFYAPYNTPIFPPTFLKKKFQVGGSMLSNMNLSALNTAFNPELFKSAINPQEDVHISEYNTNNLQPTGFDGANTPPINKNRYNPFGSIKPAIFGANAIFSTIAANKENNYQYNSTMERMQQDEFNPTYSHSQNDYGVAKKGGILGKLQSGGEFDAYDFLFGDDKDDEEESDEPNLPKNQQDEEEQKETNPEEDKSQDEILNQLAKEQNDEHAAFMAKLFADNNNNQNDNENYTNQDITPGNGGGSGALNNYGNIRDPKTGEFKNYATPEQGRIALENQLNLYKTGKTRNNVNPNSSLYQAMAVYAPAADRNNPKKYAEFIANRLGISPTTAIKNIDVKAWADAVTKMEGNKNIKYQTGGVYDIDDNELQNLVKNGIKFKLV